MALKKRLARIFYKFLQKQDYYFTRLAIHGMKWRGFSKHSIHPKHLFDTKRSESWLSHFHPGSVFLDVGSGTGTECLRAAEKGAQKALGLEYNKQSLEIARTRSADKNLACEFVEADLEKGQLPIESRTVDLINFSNCLEHLNHRQEILKELKRIKKNDGLVVLSVPNRDTPWKQKLRAVGLDSRDDDDHKIEYSVEALKKELTDSGFEIISPLAVTIPSFPWNGILAATAIVSPKLYMRLQKWKREYVERHPETSTGWVLTIK